VTREARAHRVEHDVARQLEQMCVALDELIVVPTLEEVPGIAVAQLNHFAYTPFNLCIPTEMSASGVWMRR
jgi:hypothetical protein